MVRYGDGHARRGVAAVPAAAGRAVRAALALAIVSLLLGAAGVGVVLVGGWQAQAPATTRASGHVAPSANLQRAVSFERIDGRFGGSASYALRTSKYTALVGSGETVLVLSDGTTVHTQLAGAAGTAVAEGVEPLAGRVNYLLGNDPALWHTNVPTYGGVIERGAYPGIDAVYRGSGGELEYDFVVTAGASANVIDLRTADATLSLDRAGNLMVHTVRGVVVQHRPGIYQEIGGRHVPVAGGFVLRGPHDVGFVLGAVDQHYTVTIDPTIGYSTDLGGSGNEDVLSSTAVGYGDFGDIAVGSAGNAYLVGNTTSTNFPTLSPLQASSAGGTDVYVTKLAADGRSVVWSTYLGGSRDEQGRGIVLDSSGDVYVVGTTSSSNFPTAGSNTARQASSGGGNDGFVAKLSADGATLVFGTYLGGSGQEAENGVAVDASGNAYVAGETTSSNFSTLNPFQSALTGISGATVVKYSPTGSMLYATYLGGTGTNATGAEHDRALGISVDGSGSAYVTGSGSDNFPTTTGAFQTTTTASCAGNIFGGCDIFVTKFNPSGSTVAYSTLLSGTAGETGREVKLDPGCASNCDAYVTGTTISNDYPTTAGAFQRKCVCGNGSAVVTKLNATGSALVYSTYIHGPGFSDAFALGVDGSGDAWFTGTTHSGGYPVTTNATQPKKSAGPGRNLGSYDAFVTELNPSGSGLVFSTFEGGRGLDIGEGLAVDAPGSVYVSGRTRSLNFPVTSGAFQTTFGGGTTDAWVTKYSLP